MVQVLDRPAVESKTTQAMKTIQEHLDKEAKNRRQTNLTPRELCPLQKAEMVWDLMEVLK